MPTRTLRSDTGFQPFEASGASADFSKPGMTSAPTARSKARAAEARPAVSRNERRVIWGPKDFMTRACLAERRRQASSEWAETTGPRISRITQLSHKTSRNSGNPPFSDRQMVTFGVYCFKDEVCTSRPTRWMDRWRESLRVSLIHHADLSNLPHIAGNRSPAGGTVLPVPVVRREGNDDCAASTCSG